MIKKVLTILSIVICTLCTQSFAQTDPYVDNEQLPETSAQGDFGGGASSDDLINVDLFTGVADINIPIYKYSVDGLDLGVSLGYNTKGIEVDQTASSIGLGWSLNAGGYISRSVNGIEDEVMRDGAPGHDIGKGFSDGTVGGGVAEMGKWVDASSFNYTLPNGSPIYTRETEYDEFTAVFGGRSVVFTIDENGSVTTSPHCNIKVERMYIAAGSTTASVLTGTIPPGMYHTETPDVNAYGIYGFTGQLTFRITDEQGNVFEFGVGDYERKMGSNGQLYYPTTRWVLNKITTFSGQVVTYDYSMYSAKNLVTESDVVHELFEGGMYSTDLGSSYAMPIESDVRVAHISNIYYPNNTQVRFDMSTAAARCDVENISYLRSISVMKNSNVVYQYKMKQTYLNSVQSPGGVFTGQDNLALESPTDGVCPYIAQLHTANSILEYPTTHYAIDTLSLGLRLSLNGITKLGSDGIAEEPYFSFIYNTNHKLPLRLSIGQDWYGYYNNATFQVPLVYGDTSDVYNVLGGWVGNNTYNIFNIPYHELTVGEAYGVDKTPNFEYMQSGILTKIINGVGGEIDLNYQVPPNLQDAVLSYAPDLEVTNTYDGLCIDHVDSKDGYNPDNNATTTYEFTNGYRFFPGGYFWYANVIDVTSNTVGDRTYTNHMVSPLDYVNGSNHGYSNVSVKKYGYNNELLSRSDNFYNNIINNGNYSASLLNDDQSQETMHTLPATSFNQPYVGLLTKVEDYGNSNSVLHSTTFQYQQVPYTAVLNVSNFAYSDIYNGSQSATRTYELFTSACMNLIHKTDITYAGGQSQTNTRDYKYDGKNRVKKESWTGSGGEPYRTISTYNYDIIQNHQPDPTIPDEAEGYNTVNAMNDNGIEFLISQETRKGPGPYNEQDVTPHDSVISFLEILPSYITGPNGNSIIVNKYSASSTLAHPIPTTSFHSNNGSYFPKNSFYNFDGNVSSKKEFTLYDDHNNLLELWTNQHQRVSSQLWDAAIGKRTAVIQNAQYNDVAYTSFEEYGASGQAGNWQFDEFSIQYPGYSIYNAVTGQNCYELNSFSDINSANALTLNKKYLITFWATSTPTVTVGSQDITLQQITTINGWSLYAGDILGDGNSSVRIHSISSIPYIDELRIYPSDAIMNTYTYDVLKGVTSHCDDRNNIVHYEYDAMGRLHVVRDMNGNIISLTDHVIAGSDN